MKLTIPADQLSNFVSAKAKGSQAVVLFLELWIAQLSPFHQQILQFYVQVFSEVAKKSKGMSPENVAICVGPAFIASSVFFDDFTSLNHNGMQDKENLDLIKNCLGFVQALIENFPALFKNSKIKIANGDDMWEFYKPELQDELEEVIHHVFIKLSLL